MKQGRMETITMKIVSTTFVVVALATNADAAKSQADRIGWYVGEPPKSKSEVLKSKSG